MALLVTGAVIVYIPVLLNLGSDCRTADATGHESTKRELALCETAIGSSLECSLYSVEYEAINDCRMISLVKHTAPLELSSVEFFLEQPLDLGTGHGPSAPRIAQQCLPYEYEQIVIAAVIPGKS